MSKIVGAILCGGESRRMGYHKAGIVQSNGLTITENLYEALDPYCQETVLVGHAKGVPDSLAHLKRVPDNYSHCGPLGGLEALLKSKLGDLYIVAPCDLYEPDPRIFELLLMHEQQAPVVIRYQGRVHPLVGIYPSRLQTLAAQHLAYNRLAMRDFIETCRANILEIPDELGIEITNANSPRDLRV